MTTGEPCLAAERQDAVDLLQQAVRIDTVSPSGDERRLARLLQTRLRKAGVDGEIDELGDKRANLIARLDGGKPGPCVVLSGHMDTVAAGTVPWRHGPFDAVLEDGRIYGRGTVDMKSGLLALMFAFLRFARRDRSSWSGTLVFAATSNEETGAQGAKAMVHDGRLPRFDALIIGEPTDRRLVIAHKGVLWTRICSCGKAAHGSMPDAGVNAIDKLFSFYCRLGNVDLASQRHDLLTPATLAVTTVNGGTQVNVIPDRCDLTLDIRTVPGQVHDAVRAQLRRLIQEASAADAASQLEMETLLDLPGVATDPQAELVKVAQETLREAGLASTTPVGANYFTDASVLQALGKNIIVLGPGNPRLAHQVDEHVLVDDYVECIDIYDGILKKFLAYRQ